MHSCSRPACCPTSTLQSAADGCRGRQARSPQAPLPPASHWLSLQLREQLDAFLRKHAGANGGNVAQLPVVTQAPGFERYEGVDTHAYAHEGTCAGWRLLFACKGRVAGSCRRAH